METKIPATTDRLLVLDEIAELIRVPVTTLRFWRHNGRGPLTFKVGRRVVARESDVRAWLKEQEALTAVRSA